MKDNWLKDIHDRMADFNIDEPDKLWENIEASGMLDRISRRNRHRQAIIAWTKRVGAAAAVIAIALLTGTLFYESTPDLSMPENIDIRTAGNHHIDDKKHGRDNTYEIQASAQKKTITQKTVIAACDTVQKPVSADQKMEEKIPSANDIKQTQPQHDNTAPIHKKAGNTYRDLTLAAVHPRADRHLSVSIHTSGGLGNTSSHKDFFSGALSALGPADDCWNDSPTLDMLILNKKQEIETEVNHRLPVRTGISVSYDITDRLAVESGLTYTFLASDIKQSGENHIYSGKQELHYIGIPVNIKYRICSWKAVDLYASGGVLAEKCVSGKLNKDYSPDNNNTQSMSEHITVKPLQWSANASAGVQCNLSDAVGLYAEPGISYYFDNGSKVRTIYSDRPLNFNLNVGLRFTLGNKRKL